jgi:hypothetical protein
MKIITEDINKNIQNILGILKHDREVICCTKISSCSHWLYTRTNVSHVIDVYNPKCKAV